MNSLWIALAIFGCLVAASLLMMQWHPKLAAQHRDDETNSVIRLVANIFVVMTSLVFGLMINSQLPYTLFWTWTYHFTGLSRYPTNPCAGHSR